MRLFVKNTFFFISFTGVFYILALILWGEFVPSKLQRNLNYKLGSIGQMQLRLEDLKTVKNVDILFVGSSTSYRGYDTRIFEKSGIESFNLGSSAQTPIQTQYLLDRYLSESMPKLLIIDVNPLMFTIDGVESSLDIITNDDFNKNLIKLAIKVNHLKVYNTLIYAYFADIFNVKKRFHPKLKRNNATYIKGGFVEHKLSYFKKINYAKSYWNFNKKQFQAFNELIISLKTNNVNYIIVQSPITPELYFSHQNNDTFDQYMNKHGRYLNFNYILSMDDSLHFVDAYHLNQKGVELFNKKLLSDSLNLISH